MLTVFIRLVLIYVLLIGTLRIMGKRQIGELQLSELITTILLSELASQPITDSQIPLAFAAIPAAVLLSLEVMISFAVTKLPFLKPIFDGKPNILIDHGVINQSEIAKVRISLEELLSALRIEGISDICDVDYAILEHNGQLSVIPKKNAAPPTAEDMHLNLSETGIAHAVIVDTHISDFDLQLIGKSRAWLEKRLDHYKVKLSDVYLFTVNDSGKENLIKK